MSDKISKVVLAYSGGLDTSVILKWLIETYQCEVIAFSADIGQDDDLNQVEQNALNTGAAKAYIEDLTETFSALGLRLAGVIPSPILGPKGNQEYLAYLKAERFAP